MVRLGDACQLRPPGLSDRLLFLRSFSAIELLNAHQEAIDHMPIHDGRFALGIAVALGSDKVLLADWSYDSDTCAPC